MTSTGDPVAPVRSHRLWWFGGAGLVVAAGVATAGVLLATSGDSLRGELTASLAAQHFVAAINAGDQNAAAALACDNFADEARSAATSGADPGIDFVLDSVQLSGTSDGTAEITQRLRVGGTTQRQPYLINLDRTDGRWLVCGEQQ